MTRVQWSNPEQLLLLLESLTVYRNVVNHPPLSTLSELLCELERSDKCLHSISRKYHELCAYIGAKGWKQIILSSVLRDESLTRVTPVNQEENAFKIDLIKRDLSLLQILSELTARDLKAIINKEFGGKQADFAPQLLPLLGITQWPEWKNEQINRARSVSENSQGMRWLENEQRILLDYILSCQSWADASEHLLNYYTKVGAGVFSSHVAFRWVKEQRVLEGIERPDQITIEQLIGQTREQTIVLENTLHFINGFPANNVILYGDRGTGKSSLVKALLNEYAPHGLRLIELHKTDLEDYPQVVRQLKDLPQKFIIFIDDLSFDDTEPEYKSLKTLLEGGIEVRPENVLIYATSNRRHLVKESFSERQGNDVHVRDNQEEKLSLADRFGITVTFPAPDQESYLRIVESLAKQEQLSIDRDELRQRALRWLLLHNGRSGRTARQFIDHLIGEELFKKQSR